MPEKTLEHWLSMHLARKFSTARLWWPAVGEDISVEGVPRSPGKSVLLEVKTTEWDGVQSQHRLTLDVNQLLAYQSSLIPVYYVLPIPPWSGLLDPGNPWLGSRSRTELLLPGRRWFGEWTFVVSAKDLWHHLGPPKSRWAQKTAVLFTHAAGSSDLKILVPPLTRSWTWERFWTRLGSCGSPDMPSLIAAPGGSSLGAQSSRQRLIESFPIHDEERSSSDPSVGNRSTPDLYGPTGDNDVYGRLSETALKDSLAALSRHHRSTALVHLAPSDLIRQREALKR